MVGVYYLKFTQTHVFKHLQCNHPVGKQLCRDLKRPGKLKRFRHVIEHSSQKQNLGKHIVSGRNLTYPGDYSSPIILGMTLSQLSKVSNITWNAMDPSQIKRHQLITAIGQLQTAIRKTIQNPDLSKKKFITGDWALHNLVYDEKNNNIVNVDLEGFYTYSRDGPPLSWNPKENHVPSILKNLRHLIWDIEQTLSRTKRLKKDLFLISDKAS